MAVATACDVHGEGTWSTPGGHLNFGEDPSDCARREVAEETGLSVTHVRFLGVTSDIFDATGHYVTLWFEATAFEGEPALSAPEEMSDFGWFPRGSFRKPLFTPPRRLLAGDCLGAGIRRHCSYLASRSVV
jgi:8-oxo-dGTP diphosphatase